MIFGSRIAGFESLIIRSLVAADAKDCLHDGEGETIEFYVFYVRDWKMNANTLNWGMEQ